VLINESFFLARAAMVSFAEGPCMFSAVIVACGDQIHVGVEQNPLIRFLVAGSV
jgi:hypothetical protein